MRWLVVITLLTLLAGCGGNGDDDAGNTAPTVAVPSTSTQAAVATPPPTAPVSTSTATQPPTPTETPQPTATATAALPTPVVAGSPQADLPPAGSITAAVAVGRNPLAIAAGHGAIWVQNDVDGTVSRIDPATNAVVATTSITPPVDPSTPATQTLGLRPASADLAIDAAFVWATKPAEQAIAKIDPQTNAVVASIPLETDVTSLAIGGSSLWVSLFSASSVARIDTTTGEIVATIAGIPSPAGIAVSPDAVWVANYWSDKVTRIDPQTNQVVVEISLRWPGAPRSDYQCSYCALEVLADGQGVWVILIGANAVARIDPATNVLVAIIPVGSQPKSLASDARGLWVGHGGSAGVLLIDPTTNQVVAAVPAAEAPNQLPMITLWENTLWAARLATNDVSRIDLLPE